MSALDPSTRALAAGDDLREVPIDEAHLAAAAFLARYRARTLEAYRYDLRVFFQWAADHGLDVLAATRPEIELYVRTMEEQGCAATTIDRRLSTVCGMYCFAHIDGRISSNPAQYVHRPKVHESQARGLDRSELGTFLFTAERYDHAHAALAVLLGLNGLRVSEACSTNSEELAFERGHRVLRVVGKGNKPATIPLVPRTARTIDLAIGERQQGPIFRRADGQPRPPYRAPMGPLDRGAGGARGRSPAHASECVHHGCPRSRRPSPGRPDRDPDAPTREPQSATTTADPTSTSTPPTSSSPS